MDIKKINTKILMSMETMEKMVQSKDSISNKMFKRESSSVSRDQHSGEGSCSQGRGCWKCG